MSVLEQIEQFLVVDLQKTAVNSVIIRASIRVAILNFVVVFLLNFSENLFDSPWNDTELGFVIEKSVNITIEAQPTKSVLPRILIVIPMLPKHSVSFA